MSEANFFHQGAVPISAIVITKDEEANIGRCLSSLYWVAEVIVVDCGSTDRTRELAMGFANVKLIDHEWEGYSANKRVAVSFTRHKWVLWLDADEEVTYDLQHEILSLPINQFSLFDAFDVCRNTYFLSSPSATLYPSRTARLFNKDKLDFNNKILHEGLHITDKKRLGRLQFSLNHYSFRSLDQFFNKMNTYGRYGGLELLRKRKLMGKWRLVLSPVYTFFKYYFLNGGILDRKHGLMMSLGSSYANYIKYSHYYYLLQEDRRSLLRERLKGKTIIVSRTDNIGDVILTLPLVVLIKKHIPGVKVIFLGKRYTESIIDAFPSVDSFIAVEDLMEGKKKLSAIGAEAILFAFPDRSLSMLAFKAGISLRVGTARRWFHLLYGNRNIWFTRKNSNLHEAQLNLNLLHPLGIHDGLSLPAIGKMYQLEPKENLPAHLNELLMDSRFKLICHPKSRGSAREWPLSHYALLCSQLPVDKFLILITGTKEEGDLIRNSGFWEKVPSHVKDLTGSMNLAQFLRFISKADGLLACSTGPLHMASALGKPALGLYPPMHPIHAGRWAPLGPKARYITLRKNCTDCRNGGPCACIEAIEVNEVQGIIEKW